MPLKSKFVSKILNRSYETLNMPILFLKYTLVHLVGPNKSSCRLPSSSFDPIIWGWKDDCKPESNFCASRHSEPVYDFDHSKNLPEVLISYQARIYTSSLSIWTLNQLAMYRKICSLFGITPTPELVEGLSTNKTGKYSS